MIIYIKKINPAYYAGLTLVINKPRLEKQTTAETSLFQLLKIQSNATKCNKHPVFIPPFHSIPHFLKLPICFFHLHFQTIIPFQKLNFPFEQNSIHQFLQSNNHPNNSGTRQLSSAQEKRPLLNPPQNNASYCFRHHPLLLSLHRPPLISSAPPFHRNS
ncbi:hypothetical protein ACS0TY_025871 [Phlomoides rotata]